VLRIFFSTQDVARTRVAPAPDPVWELVLSLHLLQGRVRDPTMAGWRRTVWRSIRRQNDSERFRLLFALTPPRGYFPDFLTPYEGLQGLDAGLEAVAATPTAMLRRDLGLLARDNVLPISAVRLARGEVAMRRHLVDSMRRYHATAIAPYWKRIRTAIEADRNRRARAFLNGGTEGLLASLDSLRWESGVLEVPDYPTTRELHLDDRGLLLIPSFFCMHRPVALFDPALPPVLVYPVDRLGGLGKPTDAAYGPGQEEHAREALAALLGRTRAQVLEVVNEGCSTGEAARRLAISPAAVSQHTAVLRNAGLLVSQRERNTVRHTLTPLGRAILNR